MRMRAINAPDGAAAIGGYAQAIEVTSPARLLSISGQIPETADGTVPEGFEDQARLAWANIIRQLNAAGMTLDNLVRHTTWLADRRYRESNSRIRQEVLGHRAPALTVVVAEIYDPAWLLEIEAIAAA